MAKTRFYLRLAGLFTGLCMTAALRSQTSASASFDPARVETGDTFSLRVLVKGAAVAPREVDFSPWKNYLNPAKNILSQSDWTHSGAQWVQRFTLIAFDSAVWQLPPLSVRLHLGDSILTNPVDLSITPTPAGDDPRDMDVIRDIRREPVHWTDYWPWGAGGGLLLLLLLVYLRKRRPRPRRAAPVAPPPPPAPEMSPAEIALQKLAALAQEQPWRQGRILVYYTDLSFVLREYLEGRYGIHALESTTREIEALLKNTGFPDRLKAPLMHLLLQSDLVKYAETPPVASFHEKALESAREVVVHT